uniref:Uncharacterized protein n=1 Tax=Oryza brachyantha TaxID=4533 RepID=J3LGL3_ORYBR
CCYRAAAGGGRRCSWRAATTSRATGWRSPGVWATSRSAATGTSTTPGRAATTASAARSTSPTTRCSGRTASGTPARSATTCALCRSTTLPRRRRGSRRRRESEVRGSLAHERTKPSKAFTVKPCIQQSSCWYAWCFFEVDCYSGEINLFLFGSCGVFSRLIATAVRLICFCLVLLLILLYSVLRSPYYNRRVYMMIDCIDLK